MPRDPANAAGLAGELVIADVARVAQCVAAITTIVLANFAIGSASAQRLGSTAPAVSPHTAKYVLPSGFVRPVHVAPTFDLSGPRAPAQPRFTPRRTRSGNASANRIRGTALAEAISGLGGADMVWGAGGNDVLNGDSGPDRVDGGPGSDWVAGSAGGDRLLGGAGADLLTGGFGIDVLLGGPGSDLL